MESTQIRKKRSCKGYTLVELMAVIAIMAALAAVAAVVRRNLLRLCGTGQGGRAV